MREPTPPLNREALFAADIVQRKYDADNSTASDSYRCRQANLSEMLSVLLSNLTLSARSAGRRPFVATDGMSSKLLLDKPGNSDST